MVLTRSQTSDSPRKFPVKRTPRKSRAKTTSESSSDEECTIELRDIRKSLNENLGTIAEENEDAESPHKFLSISLAKLDQRQGAVSTNGVPAEKEARRNSLEPIREESDCDSSEAELMSETEKESSQEVPQEPTEIEGQSSRSTIVDTNTQSSTKMELLKNRFYFPPPKSLLPARITSTSIDAGMEIKDTYIDMKSVKKAKKKINDLYSLPETAKDPCMKDSVITPDFEAKHSVPVEKSRTQQVKDRRAQRLATAGKEWFNLKPPEMTDEVKRDLEILQMRGILDPKRFYKHNDRKSLPKYFQIGRIMDNPADFYSSRVPKKQRKPNLTEELLADAEFRQYQKRKYNEIQIKQKARGEKRRRMKHGKFSKRNKQAES